MARATKLTLHQASSQALHGLILRSDVRLLDTLLATASSDNLDEDKASVASMACIALLARPLPAETLLPESAQKFFLRLAEQAVTYPSVETLRPIYQLLTGACQELLSTLPTATLTALADDIFKILRSLASVEGNPQYLLCLGIIRSLAGLPVDTKAGPISPVSTSKVPLGRRAQPWKLDSARAYFVTPKALKTLQLVALQVIWIYKVEDQHSEQYVLENLEIATSIVYSIDTATRLEWCKANAPVARKLGEKVMKSDLPADIRLAGFVFLSALIVDPRSLSSATHTAAGETLLEAMKLEAGGDSLLGFLGHFLTIYGDLLSPECVGGLLMYALDVSIGERTASLNKIKRLALLLHDLKDRCRLHASFRQLLHIALSPSRSSDLRQRICKLHEILEHPSLLKTNSSSEACETTVFRALQALSTALQQLIVGLMFLEPQQTVYISRSDASKLLFVGRHYEETSFTCRHSMIEQPRMRAIPLQPSNGAWSSRTWSHRLEEALSKDLHNRHGSIVQLVNEVCEDLQRRCDHAEEPARQEQAKNEALSTDCSALKRQLQTAEENLAELHEELQLLRAKERESAEQLHSSKSTSALLLAGKQELERAVLSTREKGEVDIQSLHIEYESKVLAHQGERAALMEELEDMKEQVLHKDRHLERATERHTDLEIQLENEKRQTNSKADELATREKELMTLNEDRENLREELASTRDTEANMRVQILDLDTKCAQRNTEIDDLQRQLQETRAVSKTDLQAAETAHTTALERLLLAERQLRIEHSDALAEAAHQLDKEKAAHNNTEERFRAVSSQLRQSATSVQKLELELCEARTDLQETRIMRKRLMQAMGIQDSLEAMPATGGREHATTTMSMSAADGIVDPATHGHFASEASSSGGPTPKRTKPRASFRIPNQHSVRQFRLHSASAARTARPMPFRQPLRETPGRANTGVPIISKSAGKARVGTDAPVTSQEFTVNAEDLEFDDTDLFTSTPLLSRNSRNKDDDDEKNREVYDETTADF